MSSSRVMVGLPFEKKRLASRGGLRKWTKQSLFRREPTLKSRPVRPAPLASPEPDTSLEEMPQPNFEALALPSLAVHHFIILSFILLVVVLLAWGLILSNHLSVALRYEISALTKERLELQERSRQLKMELAEIGSLEQLEEAARGVLGLITPNQGQIVVIEP